MKKVLLLSVLTVCASPLRAQQAPNRENIGEVPGAPSGTVPATPNHAPGAEGIEAASGKSLDERFIHQAAQAGHMEVKIAEMALTKASRDDLKAFASMIVKEHSAANAELLEIAKSLGLEISDGTPVGSHGKTDYAKPENDPSGRRQTEALPKDPTKEGGKDRHQALKDKTGSQFDIAFMEVMEQCHQEDITLFEKAQGMVKASRLKGFIDKTLPVLTTHAAALAALERIDPSRPNARTGSPAETPSPVAPKSPDAITPNR